MSGQTIPLFSKREYDSSKLGLGQRHGDAHEDRDRCRAILGDRDPFDAVRWYLERRLG